MALSTKNTTSTSLITVGQQQQQSSSSASASSSSLSEQQYNNYYFDRIATLARAHIVEYITNQVLENFFEQYQLELCNHNGEGGGVDVSISSNRRRPGQNNLNVAGNHQQYNQNPSSSLPLPLPSDILLHNIGQQYAQMLVETLLNSVKMAACMVAQERPMNNGVDDGGQSQANNNRNNNNNNSKSLNSSKHNGTSTSNSGTSSNSDNTVKRQSRCITLGLHCWFANCPGAQLALFVDVTALDEHLATVHCLKQYRCFVRDCGASFDLASELSKHRIINHPIMHTENDDQNGTRMPTLHCGQCDKLFSTHDSLSKHHYNMHVRGSYQCTENMCGKIHSTKQQADLHFRGVHRPRITCSWPDCRYRSTHASDVRRHYQRKHSDNNNNVEHKNVNNQLHHHHNLHHNQQDNHNHNHNNNNNNNSKNRSTSTLMMMMRANNNNNNNTNRISSCSGGGTRNDNAENVMKRMLLAQVLHNTSTSSSSHYNHLHHNQRNN